ncbi:SusE domain-containing protein [Flavobacterium croceum]|uniref:SusE domain-containing protein n=1 Tax=Flavobacterium croceum TaxID=370975 RepID=UPI0024A9C535|nr:SusE domain-containing protein [Flavobacterium croceum]
MKKILNTLLALVVVTSFTACEDEQDLMLSQPTGSFTIKTPTNGDGIVLSESTPTNPGISLTWNAADYGTQSAITYTVQLAPNGSDFSNAQDLGTTTNTNITIQSAQLNLAALTAGATPFTQSPVDIRIKATSGTTGSQASYSNVITYMVTCYGCLGQYAVGAGIPSAGWGWSTPLSLICDNNVLTASTTLANDAFRIFTENGNWSSGRNYPWYVTEGYKISSTLINANDGDSNFKFTGTPGAYRLKIDGNNKTFTIAKGADSSSSQWLVGAATPGGWSWNGNDETEFPLITNGIFEVPVKLNNGETFRFFNTNGDWGSGQNYPWYVNNGYTIDSELINGLDGDSNFRYVGPTAIRMLKVDTVAKTITVD